MPEFVNVGPAADVPPGSMKRYVIDGLPVTVYNCGGTLYATHDTCTHAEASLSEGTLDCDEGYVECPLHGARFDVRTGKVLCMPAITDVKSFAVKVEAGNLYIAV